MNCSNASAILRYTLVGDLCRDISVSVGESSDDNLRTSQPEPFAPAESWIEAFDAQCTDAMLKRLRRYAFLLARQPGGEHLGDHAAYAEETVQGAVADLAAGVLRWDPLARDLEPYLADVIRLRVRRDRKRAARHQEVSLDAVHPKHRRSPMRDPEMQLVASAPAHTDESEENVWGSMPRNMQRLRERVSADPLAQRFLDAVELDATTRAEIMRVAGITRAEFHNTRRRLARLLAHLDPGRRTPAKDN
jgi:hypothetical protein